MSELLFPHARHRAQLKVRLAVLGVTVSMLFAAASLWLGASFVGIVGGDVVATARVVSLGDSLGVNSSVKFRGLRVGRVVSLDTERDDEGLYAAKIVVEEEFAGQIPADVVARVLPGTLFGAEYLELRAPGTTLRASGGGSGSGSGLEDGVELAADTSSETVRLMNTFSAMYRVIDSIDPESVDLAVSQLADALRGRGQELHDAVGRIAALATDWAAAEPAFYRDLDYLARNLDTLADLEPDLVAILKDSQPVAHTIAGKAKDLEAFFTASAALADGVSTFLEQHGDQLVSFLDEVAPTYRAFIRGTGAFERILALAPGVLHNGATAIADGAIQMAAKFSADVRDPYTSAECPRYGDLEGRNCR